MDYHIIVIDDNSTGLKVMAQFLEAAGIGFTPVQDARKLAAVLEQTPRVDAVFLDLEMPAIDGFAVLDYLKNDLGLAAPIIAYTVHTSEINEAQRAGFDGFVGKPLSKSRFPEQLQRILNGQPVWEV